MTEDQKTELFREFQQVHRNRKEGGTGLGLAISKQLIDLMDGEIGVDSTPGEGSTFWFRIPIAPHAPAAELADLTGLRVLAVDDNPAVRQVIERYLAGAGATVHTTASAEAARREARALANEGEQLDAMLIDSLIDEEDGLTLARRWRKDDSLPQPPLIYMAPQLRGPLRRRASEAGFFGTLGKPLRRDYLCRGVGAAAGRTDMPDPHTREGPRRSGYRAPQRATAEAEGGLILVAEDNLPNQVIIGKLMDRLGYAYVVVGDGVEAESAMQDERFGMVLTDCVMPRRDGFEFVRRLREWEAENVGEAERTPVVALTADAMEDTQKACLEAGMDDVLVKPVEFAQLDDTIQRWLPQAAELRESTGEAEAASGAGEASGESAPRDPVGGGAAAGGAAGDGEGEPAVLDLARVRQIYGEIDDEARDLLNDFIETTRPQVAEIQRGLAEGELETARQAAHAAKGAANLTGAYAFAAVCSEINDALKGGDSERARQAVEGLESTFEEVARAVDKL